MRDICKTCEYIRDARNVFIDGPGGPKWACPALLDAESDNCFKRGENRDEYNERSTEAMDLNVTISLSETDRALIRGLVSAVWEAASPRAAAVPMPETETRPESAPMPDFDATPKSEARPETTPEPEAKPAPEAKADNERMLEEAREIIRAHSKTHRVELKGLLTEYKARKASEVPTEALPEFLKRLKELTAA